MIKISNVSKHFDNDYVLNDINIEVKKGTVHGLIGENGAGKTTLINCLTGVYKPNSGNILICGEPVYENPKVKAKIGYVADSCNFLPYYKVKNMVRFYEGIYKSFKREIFNTLNQTFRLNPEKRVNQLSKGMKMRLSFMLNMAIEPEVLILDEPTSGLDAIAKKELFEILIEAVEKNNLTVFISSHHLSELERLCDEITIINKGKITYQSSIDSIKQRIKKLQILFKDKPNFEGIEGIIKVGNIGSIQHIITENYNDKLISELKQRGAVLIEDMGMSLEEIFIYTNREEKI